MTRPVLSTSALGAVLLALGVAGCSGGKTETIADRDKETMYKHGSLFGNEGGVKLFGNSSNKGQADQGGLGVNSFLWRGSLDSLSFMPIASADPFGGVIITDWYSPPETPGERFKVNVYILDKQLRADGVRATVFKQARDGAGWRDLPVAQETNTKLEDTILTRARQLRVTQSEK